VIIKDLVHHYNEKRLHATLAYMTLATWHWGQPEQVPEERASVTSGLNTVVIERFKNRQSARATVSL
jgi:hypothetical protein